MLQDLNRAMFKGTLQNDNLNSPNEIVPLNSITAIPVRRGLDQAIISNGKVVNIVSKTYSHLPNQVFFTQAENAMLDSGLKFDTRKINREDRSFAMEFILHDDRYAVNVKNDLDKIKPMLRFTNSYDGSCRSTGKFGFFRQVCSNGLHVAQSRIGFSVKHTGNVASVILPKIDELFNRFMDNEFYEIKRKFEVLAETPIGDIPEYVAFVTKENNLFRFEKSDTNPEPSKLAQQVIDNIKNESLLLHSQPNAWIAYNAFNEVIHGSMKRTFGLQEKLDVQIFDSILSMA